MNKGAQLTQQQVLKIFKARKKWAEATVGWRTGHSGIMIKVYQPNRSKTK